MKVIRSVLKFLIIILLASAVPSQVKGQDAKVRRVTSTTSDGLVFSVWVTQQNLNFGQDIIIHYGVINSGPLPIYLVRDNTFKTVIEGDTIIFPRPFVPVGGHEDYNYRFTKVARGESYRGQLKVSKDEYKEAQLWRVNVGFGYVNNLKGLTPRPEEIADPAPFKSLLDSRIQTLLLSSLCVDVMER
jgi:hypothetical protein